MVKCYSSRLNPFIQQPMAPCPVANDNGSFPSGWLGAVSRTSQGGFPLVWPNWGIVFPGLQAALPSACMADHVSKRSPIQIQLHIEFRPPPRPVTAMPWIPAASRNPHSCPPHLSLTHPSLIHPSHVLASTPTGRGRCSGVWHWDSHPLNLHHCLR